MADAEAVPGRAAETPVSRYKVVTAKGLVVRDGPDLKSKQVATLQRGTAFAVFEVQKSPLGLMRLRTELGWVGDKAVGGQLLAKPLEAPLEITTESTPSRELPQTKTSGTPSASKRKPSIRPVHRVLPLDVDNVDVEVVSPRNRDSGTMTVYTDPKLPSGWVRRELRTVPGKPPRVSWISDKGVSYNSLALALAASEVERLERDLQQKNTDLERERLERDLLQKRDLQQKKTDEAARLRVSRRASLQMKAMRSTAVAGGEQMPVLVEDTGVMAISRKRGRQPSLVDGRAPPAPRKCRRAPMPGDGMVPPAPRQRRPVQRRPKPAPAGGAAPPAPKRRGRPYKSVERAAAAAPRLAQQLGGVEIEVPVLTALDSPAKAKAKVKVKRAAAAAAKAKAKVKAKAEAKAKAKARAPRLAQQLGGVEIEVPALPALDSPEVSSSSQTRVQAHDPGGGRQYLEDLPKSEQSVPSQSPRADADARESDKAPNAAVAFAPSSAGIATEVKLEGVVAPISPPPGDWTPRQPDEPVGRPPGAPEARQSCSGPWHEAYGEADDLSEGESLGREAYAVRSILKAKGLDHNPTLVAVVGRARSRKLSDKFRGVFLRVRYQRFCDRPYYQLIEQVPSADPTKSSGELLCGHAFIFWSARRWRWKMSDALDDRKQGYAWCAQDSPLPDEVQGPWMVFEGSFRGYRKDAALAVVPLRPVKPRPRPSSSTKHRSSRLGPLRPKHGSLEISKAAAGSSGSPSHAHQDLPGGWRVGDLVKYIGSHQSFDSGDQLVNGATGEIVSDDPEGGERYVLLSFPGNERTVACLLSSLVHASQAAPPSVAYCDLTPEMLQGTWAHSRGGDVIIQLVGDTFSIQNPHAGNAEIAVKKFMSGKCLSYFGADGVISGNTINWSNGSNWAKKLVGAVTLV